MFRFSVVSVFTLSYFIGINSNNISRTVPNVTSYDQNGEYIKKTVPKKLFNKLRAEHQKIETNNLSPASEIQSLRPKSETEIETLTEEANNSKQIFNESENQGSRTCKQVHELQIKLNTLEKEQNAKDNYLFHFKSKILVKNVIRGYEEIFDKLELRHSQPPFRLNETAINHSPQCWNYDQLAEKRRQRWQFYLTTPPYCNESFNRLTKRIKHHGEFTVEAFSKALSILYKRISFSVQLEAVKTINFSFELLSHYKEAKFIIPVLLADHPKTELIKKILDEVK